MEIFELPKVEDIEHLFNKPRFKSLRRRVSKLGNSHVTVNGFHNMKTKIDLSEYVLQLHQRIDDTEKSYVMMSHFKSLGIPDDEWFISPGKSGCSVEYFPHFEEIHFEIKAWFDFYTDNFFYKAFSAMDMIAQIFNILEKTDISESRVSFKRVTNKLKKYNPAIYSKLIAIVDSSTFRKAASIRNSSTHRFLPSTTGMKMTINEKGGTFGMHEYLTSGELLQVATGFLNKVEEAINRLPEKV